jgi:DNA modification methylase
MSKKEDFFLIKEIEQPLKSKKKKNVEVDLDDLSKEELQKIKSFNGLTAKEWASLSMPIWNDLSSPRNKFQLEHGAVYPVKLVERLVKMYSREGDIVFDPFMGSGTTAKAAIQTQRDYLGSEISEEYYKICIERLKVSQ